MAMLPTGDMCRWSWGFRGVGGHPEGRNPVAILAVACPDPHCSDNILTLLGTNVYKVCPFTSSTKSRLNTIPLYSLNVSHWVVASLLQSMSKPLHFPLECLSSPPYCSSAFDKTNFLVRVWNESCKEVSIPVGTTVAHLSGRYGDCCQMR